jgi:hypothetical protein
VFSFQCCLFIKQASSLFTFDRATLTGHHARVCVCLCVRERESLTVVNNILPRHYVLLNFQNGGSHVVLHNKKIPLGRRTAKSQSGQSVTHSLALYCWDMLPLLTGPVGPRPRFLSVAPQLLHLPP